METERTKCSWLVNATVALSSSMGAGGPGWLVQHRTPAPPGVGCHSWGGGAAGKLLNILKYTAPPRLLQPHEPVVLRMTAGALGLGAEGAADSRSGRVAGLGGVEGPVSQVSRSSVAVTACHRPGNL